MRKKRLQYILGELRAVSLFALAPSMGIFVGSAPWWWYKPYGTGMLMFAVPFAVFALIGILISLHDDYRIVIERRYR